MTDSIPVHFRNGNLFSKWAYNDKEMTARVLIALDYFWSVKHIGTIGSMPIVVYKNTWYCLCNNGGEINVEPINSPEKMRSIPYTSFKCILTAETIAWRLFCAMDGREIDWNYNDIPGAHGAEPLKIKEVYPVADPNYEYNND